VFAPQKGASPAQVELLRRRLDRLGQVYLDEYGVDVRELPRAGAAGGLAGALATVGARLVDGFELVADHVGLDEQIEAADLVITGEGFLDAQSFEGKVVGGVTELARAMGIPVLVVAGDVFDGADAGLDVVSLVQTVGDDRARNDTLAVLAEVVYARLRG
jgi:glycerate kinase